jgi:hypothetical protein
MQSLKTAIVSVDLSSRGKRRKVITLVIELFERIRAAEGMFIERIPLNLHNSDAYDTAEQSIDLLDEAIDVVSSIYD